MLGAAKWNVRIANADITLDVGASQPRGIPMRNVTVASQSAK